MTSPAIRIGLDARLSGKQHAGIGRYIENILARLPLLAPQIKWVYFFASKNQLAELMATFAALPEAKNVSVTDFFSRLEIHYLPVKHYSLAEQRQLPGIFEAAELDLLHVPHFNIPLFYRGSLVVTIHDLLWHEKKGLQTTTLPAWQYYLKYSFYKLVVGRAIKRALEIFVPTQTVKKSVLRHYPRTQTNKIKITPEGFYLAQPEPLSSALKAKLPPVGKANLLYVGSLYPHKNLEVVLQALQQLPADTNFHLLIIGSRDVFSQKVKARVQELKIGHLVTFLGYVPDAQLVTLYQQSLALIQPSLSEGFGLTGLEAMAAKTLVLASDIPIFHEVYGEAAIYFDPHNAADFLQKLTDLEPATRRAQLQKGLTQTTKYDWQKTATLTLNGYQKILKF